MGVGHRASIVHIIDFGLSKAFRNPHTHQHIPLRRGCGLVGTSLFASNHSHLGCELGRRDDLESLAYVLIYFLRGGLPWGGMEDPDLIAQQKLECSVEDLCHGLPVEYATLLSYSRTLPFDAKPDYDYISGLFGDPELQEGAPLDSVFDWDSEAPPAHGRLNIPYNKPPPPIIASRKRLAPATPARRTGLVNQSTALCQLLTLFTASVRKALVRMVHHLFNLVSMALNESHFGSLDLVFLQVDFVGACCSL